MGIPKRREVRGLAQGLTRRHHVNEALAPKAVAGAARRPKIVTRALRMVERSLLRLWITSK
jgi:hypothetical protein